MKISCRPFFLSVPGPGHVPPNSFEISDYYMRVFILQSFALRSLSAFPTTETELKLIAAAAKIGLNKIPKYG